MMHSPDSPVPGWFSGWYYDTRAWIAARKKICDEAKYFRIMLSDPSEYVRRAAVKRLTDQALLAQAAQEDPDEDVRSAAVQKLTDQDLLFRIAFSDKSAKVRLAAGKMLQENPLCFRAAAEHPDSAVRTCVVGNMTDQQLLARFLTEAGDKEIQLKAADRITDPSLAEELFSRFLPDREPFATPRCLLVYHIQNQALLSELALKDPDFKVRRAAASCLTDQDLLIKIVKDQGEYDRVRAAAAGQITDQAVLRNLADTYNHKLAPYDIGEEALKHIEDQQYLKSVAEDHYLMHCLRKAAAEHITDQDILFPWAMNGSNDSLHDIGLAGIAVRRLESPEYLAKVAAGAADYAVSETAVERLHNDEWLLWVIDELGKQEDADNCWIRRLRCSAVLNVEDPHPLVDFALRECNDEMDIIDSFELDCIRCIAESPSAMHDYASRFTNPDAVSWAMGFTMDRFGLEGFLENPLCGESDRKCVQKKIDCLGRLHEIGLADE